MKALRLLCNILLFIAIAIAISLVQVGVYDLSAAAQSEDVTGIWIASPHEDYVSYFDSYGFWGADIKANTQQETRYRVRNWVAKDWWKKGTKWIDVCVDFVVNFVKPIIVPVSESNAVLNYYGRSINDFEDYLLRIAYTSSDGANNALYELYVIFDRGYGSANVIGAEEPTAIENWTYTGAYDITAEYSEHDYGRWVASNKKLYLTNWKLTKYNNSAFDKYYKKFINTDESGARNIKPAAIVLYYQQYVSILLALIFIIKYPISFVSGRYVTGGKGKKGLNKSKIKDVDVNL